jgi:hypothetical protein
MWNQDPRAFPEPEDGGAKVDGSGKPLSFSAGTVSARPAFLGLGLLFFLGASSSHL